MPRIKRPAGDRSGPAGGEPRVIPSRGGIAFGGDNHGIASTGAHAVNTLIQVRLIQDAAVVEAVAELAVREIPFLSTFAEARPVSRSRVIGQVCAEIADGMSVQLYGAPGVGKKAVARAVIRQLGARPARVRGFELLPLDGQPHTLDSLYERLAQSFFRGNTFEPPETRLRVAAAAARLAAVVVIGDCELPAQDLSRLLGTFPGCAFLLTSSHRTLYRAGAVHEIGPLSLDAAIELIAQETGDDPVGLRRLQVAQAYELAAGQTQRLLQHAAFLQFARSRPGPDPLSLVPAPEQAKILISGLSEQARRVLVALATFGTELTPDCFAAVTGLPVRPPTGPGLADAGPELLAAALVSRASAAGQDVIRRDPASGRDVGYRITPDAAAAITALGWPPADALTAGRGLLLLVARQDPDTTPPSPGLLLAVAGMLRDAGENLQASRLIRAALPRVLTAGHLQDWMRLVGLGLQVASAAGAHSDLAYFVREDVTGRRLRGDKIAALAVLAGAAEQTGARLAQQSGTHLAQQAGSHLAQQSRAQAGRHSGSVMQRAARYGAKAMSAGHGAAAAGAAVAVAAAVTTVVIVARPAGSTGPPQFTGAQLASALLPATAFPAGYSYPADSAFDSGSSLRHAPRAPHAPTYDHCHFGPALALAHPEQLAVGAGTTAFAVSSGNKAGPGPEVFTDSVSQAVYQFAGPAQAAAFFAVMRACVTRPGGPSIQEVSTRPVDGNKAITADMGFVFTHAAGGAAAEPLFVLHGTDVFAVSASESQNDAALSFPGAAELIAELIARVEALGREGGPSPASPDVTLQSQPSAPLTGPAAAAAMAAQYPVLASGAPGGDSQQLDTVMQRPIVAWAEQAAAAVSQQDGSGTPSPSSPAAETTVAHLAGQLISLTYRFSGSDARPAGGGHILVLRVGTAAVLSPAAILTPAATREPGAARITSVLSARYPPTEECPALTARTLLFSRNGPHPDPDLGLQVGVTGRGVEFFLPATEQCGPQDVVIAFSQLNGLVYPGVSALAAGRSATVSQSPAASSPSPAPGSASPPGSPAAVVQGYFAAINSRQYRQAWLLGGDNVSGDSYGQFVDAFADTADDIVTIVSVTGNTVSVRLTAIQSGGAKRFFAGTYTVSGGALTAARIRQAG